MCNVKDVVIGLLYQLVWAVLYINASYTEVMKTTTLKPSSPHNPKYTLHGMSTLHIAESIAYILCSVVVYDQPCCGMAWML